MRGGVLPRCRRGSGRCVDRCSPGAPNRLHAAPPAHVNHLLHGPGNQSSPLFKPSFLRTASINVHCLGPPGLCLGALGKPDHLPPSCFRRQTGVAARQTHRRRSRRWTESRHFDLPQGLRGPRNPNLFAPPGARCNDRRIVASALVVHASTTPSAGEARTHLQPPAHGPQHSRYRRRGLLETCLEVLASNRILYVFLWPIHSPEELNVL